jgi:hypothetical protein
VDRSVQASRPAAVDPAVASEAPERPRSRRSLLAAALGGLGGSIATALARPLPVGAAAGDPLVLGQTNFAGTSATRVNATSSGGAFWMTQYGSGAGVRGEATIGTGGIFLTAAQNHYGLVGQHTGIAGTGAAVRAIGGANVGVEATTDSAGAALTATQNAALGGVRAIYAANQSTSGHAIGGYSYSNSGDPDGVVGVTQASGGRGVYGEANSSTGSTIGVQGTASSAAGIGVYGYSQGTAVSARSYGTNGYGVFAWASAATGTTYGIWTQVTSSSGWALWASGNAKVDGNLDVTGTVTGPVQQVQLDHPRLAGKVVNQEAVLSADRLLALSGLATAGSDGRAVVHLPDWFERMTADHRYHLTPIGRFAPVFVEAKLARGAFAIGGAAAGQEVSWQVAGTRRDAWAGSHPLPVVAAKHGPASG